MLLSRVVVQYGYITMFANSFTVAPVLAFWANVFTLRMEMMNTVMVFARFPSDDDPDVSVWLEIMDAICMLGVVVNVCIFFFTSSAWIDELHHWQASTSRAARTRGHGARALHTPRTHCTPRLRTPRMRTAYRTRVRTPLITALLVGRAFLTGREAC